MMKRIPQSGLTILLGLLLGTALTGLGTVNYQSRVDSPTEHSVRPTVLLTPTYDMTPPGVGK